MRGQFKEMESTGKQTDELIAANKNLVEAAQGQLKVMQGQLNEMISARKQTDALIAANQTVADAARKQAELAAVQAGAALAASQAAKQSADAVVAIERPYFFISEIKLVQPAGPTDPNAYVEYGLANLGRVPASVIMIYADCFVMDKLPEIPVWNQKKFRRGGQVTIAANTIYNAAVGLPKCEFSEPITDSDYSMLKDGKKTIFFQAFVFYEGALEFNYLRSVASSYDFRTEKFYPVGGDSYNFEQVEKRAPKGVPQLPKIVQ